MSELTGSLLSFYRNNRALIIVLLVILAAILILAALRKLRFPRRYRSKQLDQITDGFAFEGHIAALLAQNGYTGVDVTKQSGDFGVDVLAEKDDITIAVQCKLYDRPVGVKAVQEALSGREYYKRHVGVVATNSTFTQGAVELARETRILLWDREKLIAMERIAKPN